MFSAIHQLPAQLRMLWTMGKSEAGVTVPEYMLVLGIISIAVIGLWQASEVGTAVSTMSDNLATLISDSSIATPTAP